MLPHGVPSQMLFISCGLVHVTFYLLSPFYIRVCTDVRRLTTGYLLRNVSLGEFVVGGTYSHKPRQYSIAHYKRRLFGIAYCS